MAAPDPCNPCNCIPGNISNDVFKQSVLEVLCSLASSGGLAENVNLVSVGGVATSLGQKIMASSFPVVIASDQSAFPVTISAGTAVIGHVIVDAVTPGVGATNLGKAEDAPSVSGDTLVAIAVQRADTEADTTNTDGDYATLHESDGRLSVNQRDRLVTGTIDMTNGASVSTTLNLDGIEQVTVYFTRTTETGSVIFQVSIDGTTWNQVQFFSPNVNSVAGWILPATNAQHSVNNNYMPTMDVAGFKNFRIKVQAAGAGATLPYTIVGSQKTNLVTIAGVFPGDDSTQLGKRASSTSWGSGDIGVGSLFYQQANPTTTGAGGADGRYSVAKVNTNAILYVDPTLRATPTETTPTVTNTTSFTLVAANAARKYLLIQNNSAANILVSLSGGALTGIVPTSTNKGVVLIPGASYEAPSHYVTNSAITVYQTSGASINTVYVAEG